MEFRINRVFNSKIYKKYAVSSFNACPKSRLFLLSQTRWIISHGIIETCFSKTLWYLYKIKLQNFTAFQASKIQIQHFEFGKRDTHQIIWPTFN